MNPRPSWHEITALFGGTFDPPHLGHRAAVEGLFENPGVSKVLIIPAFISPQKTLATPALDRIEMAKLAFDFQGRLDVEFDLREIKRSGISFTFDTLLQVRQSRGRCAFVIGSDQLPQLHTWHRFPEVLSLSDWIILKRKQVLEADIASTLIQWQTSGILGSPSLGNEYPISNSGFYLKTVETQAPAISSTAIRENLAKSGQPLPGSLSSEVLAYLKKRRLYGSDNS